MSTVEPVMGVRLKFCCKCGRPLNEAARTLTKTGIAIGIAEGLHAGPPSHGYCPACFRDELAEADRSRALARVRYGSVTDEEETG